MADDGENGATGALTNLDGAALHGRQLRYYDLAMAAFVAILLLSNIIGAAKRSFIDLPYVGEWPFGAGVLFFPLSYVLGDVLTEVYGYARAPCHLDGLCRARLYGGDGLCRREIAARARLAGSGGL